VEVVGGGVREEVIENGGRADGLTGQEFPLVKGSVNCVAPSVVQGRGGGRGRREESLPSTCSGQVSSSCCCLTDLPMTSVDEPAFGPDGLLEGIPTLYDGGGITAEDRGCLSLEKGGELSLSVRHVEEEEGEAGDAPSTVVIRNVAEGYGEGDGEVVSADAACGEDGRSGGGEEEEESRISQPPVKAGSGATGSAEMGEVGGGGVLLSPNVTQPKRVDERGREGGRPDEPGVVRRRGTVGVNTVEGGLDAIEVTDDEKRCRQRGEKREEGMGEELCAAG